MCSHTPMTAVTSEQRPRLSEAATAQLLDDLRTLLGADRVLTGRDVHPTAVLNTALRAVGVTETLGEITTTVDELLL